MLYTKILIILSTDKIILEDNGDVILCEQPEFNILQCRRNLDFNDENPKNDKIGYIETNIFYSWGLLIDMTIPFKNISTKMVYRRVDSTESIPTELRNWLVKYIMTNTQVDFS